MTEARDWYVLTVPPQCELRIARDLRQGGLDVLVPTIERKVRNAGRAKNTRKLPIFARYVFIGVAGSPNWQEIEETEPGPVRPVKFGEHKARLSAADVEYLRTVKAPVPAGANIQQAIAEGQLARIASGPFTGLHSEPIKVGRVRHGYADIGPIGNLRKVRVPVEQLVAA